MRSQIGRFLIPLVIFFSGIIPVACGATPEEAAFDWENFANAYGYGYGVDEMGR